MPSYFLFEATAGPELDGFRHTSNSGARLLANDAGWLTRTIGLKAFRRGATGHGDAWRGERFANQGADGHSTLAH